MGAAGQVILLIEGATGLPNIGRQNFAGALQIVDFYHAMEHAAHVVSALVGQEHPEYKSRLSRWSRGLLQDEVATPVAQVRLDCQRQSHTAAVEKELGFFENNLVGAQGHLCTRCSRANKGRPHQNFSTKAKQKEPHRRLLSACFSPLRFAITGAANGIDWRSALARLTNRE